MWILESGEKVLDRPNSHLPQDLQHLLPGVLLMVRSGGRAFIEEEVDLGSVVGEKICVSTSATDEIVWAKRPNRFGPTRFVKGRQPELTSRVTVVLKKTDRDDEFVLITAFFGDISQPEPWDRHASEKSIEFWKTHALVWGSTPVVVGTETQHNPLGPE
jgi:hypothetical protein